ncbi:hypothetical protein [Gulosibacter molinativorax]|uniref:Uncharacterized protein n=1 Tax=Gulosibacter molinativorax TaxID=256821 RepID=A0ABT7CAD7_9MICO|nr:hypothetical protein [Gulosibacter molinativorax]MDJ1371774.1 hypothetical protein [Gulosibacter molinativorax]QUY60856.1 Hypotetical protein [Gulosibacter molinativorax]
MGTEFQLSGRLPKAERNGLDAHAEEFLDVAAPASLIGIVRIDRKFRKVDDDTEEVSAMAKISHIEIVGDEVEADRLAEYMTALADSRSGDTPLPVVVEGEVDFDAPLNEGFAELDDSFGAEK